MLPKTRRLIKQPATSVSNLWVPYRWEDFARLTTIRTGSGYRRFEPYPYQVEVVNLIESHKQTVIAKTRQLGISEVLVSWLLWRMLRESSFLGLVLSKGQADSSELARRLKALIDSLPVPIELATDNLKDVQILGCGRCVFRPSSISAARGLPSVSAIVFDEFAFIPNADLIFEAAYPTTTAVPDSRIIRVSTPDGQVGAFYEALLSHDVDVIQAANRIRSGELDPCYSWTDSRDGIGRCLLHWRSHPLYRQESDYLERVQIESGMSAAAVSQEYDLDFATSASQVFDPDLVRAGIFGELVNANPGVGVNYIGIDSAAQGTDFTVSTVGNWQNGKLHVINLYRKQRGTSDSHLDAISRQITEFKPSAVGIEVTGGIGELWLQELSKRHPDTRFEAIRTTRDSKASMVDRVRLGLERSTLRFPMCPIVDELLTFQRTAEGRLEASGTHKDDSVMSLAFCCAVSPLARKSLLPSIPLTES